VRERHAAATLEAYQASGAMLRAGRCSRFSTTWERNSPAAFDPFAQRRHYGCRRGRRRQPALLVPFAAAADEHQRRNAEAMVAAGAAVMLEEKDWRFPTLAGRADGLLNDPARMAAMSAAAHTQAHPVRLSALPIGSRTGCSRSILRTRKKPEDTQKAAAEASGFCFWH